MKYNKTIINILSILIVVFIILYINNLKKKIPVYSQLGLNLYEIRNYLEDLGYKELAYSSECVVDHTYLDMWFPWTFNRIISESQYKIEICTAKLNLLKNNN